MGGHTAVADDGSVYASVRQHREAISRRRAAVYLLPFRYRSMDLFFRLPDADGEHVCRQQRDDGKSLFSASCYADFYGVFGAHQLCHSVWLSPDFPGLLRRHKAGRASESLYAHDTAYRLATGDAKPWLRYHHFRTDYEIPRPCHAGRLRRTAMDVWLTNCL